MTATNIRKAWGLAEIKGVTGLSIPFLRKDIKAGNLKVTRFGRRILVSDAELTRYISEGSGQNSEHLSLAQARG
jgi:hypothetical protein